MAFMAMKQLQFKIKDKVVKASGTIEFSQRAHTYQKHTPN